MASSGQPRSSVFAVLVPYKLLSSSMVHVSLINLRCNTKILPPLFRAQTGVSGMNMVPQMLNTYQTSMRRNILCLTRGIAKNSAETKRVSLIHPARFLWNRGYVIAFTFLLRHQIKPTQDGEDSSSEHKNISRPSNQGILSGLSTRTQKRTRRSTQNISRAPYQLARDARNTNIQTESPGASS